MLAQAHSNLAAALIAAGRPEPSEQPLRRSIELLDELNSKMPEAPQFGYSLANSQLNLGRLEFHRGRFTQARYHFERGSEAIGRVVRSNSEVARYREVWADALKESGVCLAALGHSGEASAALRSAIEQYLRLGEREALTEDETVSLMTCHFTLGSLLLAQGEHEAAGRALAEAHRLADSLEPKKLGSYYLHRILQLRTLEVEQAASVGADPAEIAGRWEAVVREWEQARVAEPMNEQILLGSLDARIKLARARVAAGHHERASEELEVIGADIAQLQDGAPNNLAIRHLATNVLQCRAALAEAQGDLAKAREITNQRLQMLADMQRVEAGYNLDLARAYTTRARLDHPDSLQTSADVQNAMAILRATVLAGMDQFEAIRSDTELAPLRDRRDFQALLERRSVKP